MSSVGQIFLFTSKQEQKDSGFDIVGAVDRWRKGLRQKLEDVPSTREFVDISDIGVGQRRLGNTTASLRRKENNIIGDQRGAVMAGSEFSLCKPNRKTIPYSLEASLTHSTTSTLIHSDQLDSITRLASIHQIIRQDYFNSSRQLPCRRPLRHLLDTDRLMIPKRAQPVFHRDGMTLAIVLWYNGCGWCSREKSLSGDGCTVVICSGMELSGLLAVMNGFEHFWANERACKPHRRP